jgi:hypothetical protein
MFNWFLGAALVVAPFFIQSSLPSGTNTSVSQAFFVQIMSFLGVIFFGVNLKNNRIKIATLMVIAITLMAKEIFSVMSFYQSTLAMSGVMFMGVVASNIKDHHVNLVYKCMSAIFLIEIAWIIANYFGIDPYKLYLQLGAPQTKAFIDAHARDISGSVGNTSHTGALIAAILPFIHPLLWIPGFIALFALKSALSVFCAISGIIALYSYKKKNFKYLYALGLFIVVTGIVLFMVDIPSDSPFYPTDRVKAWKSLYNMVGLQFSGGGFGFVPSEFSKFFKNGQLFMQMHNEFAELYAVGGFMCVAIAASLLLICFKDFDLPQVNACLISLMINCLGNFTFHIAPLFIIFSVCYAIQLSRSQKWHKRYQGLNHSR